MNMPQIFKTKCIVNFRNYRSKKTAKSNKIEKTEELIAGYQEAECLWNMLSQSYKAKLTANDLNKPKQKV